MAKTNSTEKNSSVKLNSSLAREGDGTIQIIFTISQEEIIKIQDNIALTESANIEIPGFRKGKAPLGKALDAISPQKLSEGTINYLYPQLLNEIMKKHSLKPAMYPKLELIKTPKGQEWQIRAILAEIPEVEVGDYAKEIKKLSSKEKRTQAEKEQLVIKKLLEITKIQIPKVLLQDEVNQRLSSLLERIEKLGLTLENYLASLKKTPQSIREEYENQSRESLTLQLILNKIAESEKIDITPKEVDEAVKASGSKASSKQKDYAEAVLKRRKVLELLTGML